MLSIGWASCCLLLSVLGLQLTQHAVSQRLLHVALHAQSRSERHRWVAGSEITTRGLMRAFSRHPLVASVRIFAPFSYDGLHEQQWDLAIIEGYIGTVPRFIAELRSVSPGVRVMHFCLDTYPSLEIITGLDVDAFLTNSWSLLPQLAALAPTEHVLLAADPEVMRRQAPSPHYAHPIVYLGQMSRTKAGLVPMLEAVQDLGLAIYGLGWDRFNVSEGLLPYWKGILPSNDIAALYSSAGVVLGSTEAAQVQLNMVNNRVFEALACEAPLIIHPPFPGLTSLLKTDGVIPAVLAETPAMVRTEVQRLLGNATLRAEVGSQGRKLVMSLHTYDHRVAQVLDFYHRLPGVIGPTAAGGNRSVRAPRSARARRNAPHLVLAHTEVEGDDWGLRLGLLPALLQLEEQGLCRVSTVMVRGVEDLVEACRGARLLLLRAPLHHPLETALRSLDDAGCGARKGLLLPWGQPEEGMEQWLGGYSLVGHEYPEVPPHANPVWTFGASPLAAASAPLPTSVRRHNLTVGITATTGTTVVVSKEGGPREEVQHVRPETLVALVAGAGQVTVQRDSQEQAWAVISMALQTRALVELQHADPEGPLVRALAMAQGAEEEEAKAGRSALSQRLWASVSRALHGMPPQASIAIHAAGVTFPEVGGGEAARLTVQVSRRQFTMLEHGYWCLFVDGREATCVGDAVDLVTVPLGPGFNLSASSETAELQAVLVGGSLEYPEVQYTSAPVYLTAMT